MCSLHLCLPPQTVNCKPNIKPVGVNGFLFQETVMRNESVLTSLCLLLRRHLPPAQCLCRFRTRYYNPRRSLPRLLFPRRSTHLSLRPARRSDVKRHGRIKLISIDSSLFCNYESSILCNVENKTFHRKGAQDHVPKS